MIVESVHANASKIDAEIEKIAAIYSEADREMFTSELLDFLKSADLMKILCENTASGPGTLRDVLRVCTHLGKIDASLAWVVGVSNSAWSTRSSFRSLESATDATMEQNKTLSMVLGRPGALTWDKTSETYCLNGEWRYASGWQYSSFFLCVAAVEGAAAPDLRMVAVPAERLVISEQWQATGLRGTQSVTVRAQNIKIPSSNTEDYTSILAGKNNVPNHSSACIQSGIYSGLFTGVLMNCLVGSILGSTEAALDYVTATIDKSPVVGSTYLLMGDSGAIRAEIGRLRSTLDLYKRAAEYNAQVIDVAARTPGVVLTLQERVDNRGRATLIMRGCVDIVQDLLWIYGSSGLNKGSPLERIWRDVNVGARHGGFSKFVPEEAIGLSMIGRNPKDLTQMF